MLTADERSIASRKLAIAMYGYSWLKPAGCSKTMLGRREEELEREEVERQLREVEMQERMAMETEEQERLATLQEGGEPEEGRDLDDDVPEAEESAGEEGEEGMEGDLDDDIPDAEEEESGDEIDESRIGEAWVYNTNREPDSDEEGIAARQAAFIPGNVPSRRRLAPGSEYDVDERAAEELANEMLDEDEMMINLDFDEDDEMRVAGRDLDDDVPEADQGGWEHTDSELEESEMDISILPGQAHLMAGARRSSGLRQSMGRSSGARVVSGNAVANLQTPRDAQRRMQMETPQLSSDMMDPEGTINEPQQVSSTRRSWLHAASARRNLFGIGRNQQNPASGRFFTPSPAQGTPDGSPEAEEGQTPRRSGRFLGRRRGARENRESVD